jgi:thioredoxin reductase
MATEGTMPKVEPPRVAVIGAGPIGLEAALYAKTCGLPVTVYDRGGIADHVRRWGHVRLFTPFGFTVTPLGLRTLQREKPNRTLPEPTDVLTGREFRDTYLVPLAESDLLLESLQLETAVLHVGRVPGKGFRLLVRTSKNQERIDTADVVLDCSGTYATPNWLGDGHIPAVGELAAWPHIAGGVEDVLGERKTHYAGRSILLIGDSYSAATTICALAALAEEHPATWVVWISRGPRGQPLPRIANDPFKERDRLAVKANSLATRCDGNLEFHPQTVLDEVTCHGPDKGFRVAGRTQGKPISWEVERIIANVGYRPDTSLAAALRPHEPGYFVLGAKSRDAGFLMRDGFEQIKQVFASILGNPKLDLYGKKAA